MTYIEELGDLAESFKEAYNFALKLTDELCPPNKAEFRKATFQAIMWELAHDLLIVSRKKRSA